MAVSSEKITLLTELATDFNTSDDATTGDDCIFVRPAGKASGTAANLIVAGWPEPELNGEPPVIWSPAASGWAGIVNERAGLELAPPGTPFMLTPLVIAMPEPMAQALGYPDEPVGFERIIELANDPEGWASVGHPEWGPFRLGKTNPNYSTSGLNFTIAQYYAATGKTSGLTTEDLRRPEAVQFATDVESAVVHYGDITMTFLNNWFATDARGTSLTYASAVAVEEKSLIDYNLGNPDGELSPGETPREPRVPLVAIYPEEGTLFSDNPFIILDADWVTDEQKAAAGRVRGVRPTSREPGEGPRVRVPAEQPQRAARRPDQRRERRRPDPTASRVGGPRPRRARRDPRLLGRTAQGGAGVDRPRRLRVDGRPAGNGATKLDLAQQAAIDSLDQFKDTDEVGLWVFSTDLLGGDDPNYREVIPVAPIGTQRQALVDGIAEQFPQNGTPLYDVTQKSYEAMLASYDEEKINAVVFLTDGVNDDGVIDDDNQQFTDVINQLQAGSEGATSRPVRVFTISYGSGADVVTLRAIAEATSAAHYDASDPASINQVFTAVISNF